MTEDEKIWTGVQMIERNISRLAGAWAQTDPEREPKLHDVWRPLTVLIGGALIDLNRIANAIEKLQSGFVPGELGEFNPDLFGGSPTPAEVFGDETWGTLTTEEQQTIEALRRGDIVVMDSGKSRATAAAPQAAPAAAAEPIEAVDPELARIAALPVPTAPSPTARAWTGGPFSPVAGPVFIQRRDGTLSKEENAQGLDWLWHGDGDDICNFAPA